MTDDPPSDVMSRDPCLELANRAQYLRACEAYEQAPEPHPDPCHETRRRIRVAVAAWAYEVHDDPIISDAEFDALAREIDLNASTANSDMDDWFMQHFSPHTGQWVHQHPDTAGLERVYRALRRPKFNFNLIEWILAP